MDFKKVDEIDNVQKDARNENITEAGIVIIGIIGIIVAIIPIA